MGIERENKTLNVTVRSVVILCCLLLLTSCIYNQQALLEGTQSALSPAHEGKANLRTPQPEQKTPPSSGQRQSPQKMSASAQKPVLSSSKIKRIVPSPAAKRKAGLKASAQTAVGSVFFPERGNKTTGEPGPVTETASPGAMPDQKYKQYKAVLAADPAITIPGPPGRLKVWIGIPDYKQDFPIDMTKSSGVPPALGSRVRITPHAPAFKVEPTDGGCMLIDPSGSEIVFSLTPKMEQSGTFAVKAYVQFYDTENCSGIPISKATTGIQVQVVVKHVKKFNGVFRETLLKFWGEFLLFFSAVILFLLKKKLKKWIGLDKKG